MGFLKSLLLAVGLAHGQQPSPSSLIGAPYQDFSGGYVDYVSPSNLKPSQSPNLLNVKIDDPPGSLKPREGYAQCGITPSGLPATNLYEYNINSGGGVPRFIVTDSSVAWQTQDCITFTTVTTRLAGGPQPFFTTVRDKLWIVNRSTHVIVWNGTAETILDGRVNTPVPAPPRFNYIEFWNERVWGARTTSNPSGVYFSDLTDATGNDLDPSTGSVSWPATNVIQIAQENGSPIYAIKIYRNSLFAFKENGIWRIDFNSPFDITVSKTLSSAGTRYQSSVVEHDGLIYFSGLDGEYAFDGDRAVRVSDSFRNKFNDINQSGISSSQKTWDTQTDFTASGVAFSSTTATQTSGSVVLLTKTSALANFDGNTLADIPGNAYGCDPQGADSVLVACGPYAYGSPFGAYSARVIGVSGSDSGQVYVIKKVDGSTLAYTGDGTNASPSNSTIEGSTYTFNSTAAVGQVVYLHFTGGDASLYTSTFTCGSYFTFQYLNTVSGFTLLDNIQSTLYFSSGVWTSEAYNMVSISSWSTIDANYVTNGGAIALSYRVGTSGAAILNNPFVSIAPGGLISGTASDTFIQVKSTFTAIADLTTTPELADITVTAVRGTGSNQPIYAFSFKGNLYVTVSTGTSSTTNNLVFVKSRSPLDSWTLYDWQVGPMTEFNDFFYAASSTNSVVQRMAYGNNDRGQPIRWFWESRDETYERPNIRKYLMEINLDFRKGTESALTAGYSRDGGASYTSRSVSAVGSGRGTARFFMAGSNSLDYRFKVSGSTLDGTVTVLGLTGWARPAVLRE